MSGIIKVLELSLAHVDGALQNLTDGRIAKWIFVVFVLILAAANASSMAGFNGTQKVGSKDTSTAITSVIIIWALFYWKFRFVGAKVFTIVLFGLLMLQQIIIAAGSNEESKVRFDALIFIFILILSALNIQFADRFSWLIVLAAIASFFVFNSICPNTSGYTTMLVFFGIILVPFLFSSIRYKLLGIAPSYALIYGCIIAIVFFTFYLTANIDSTQKILRCNGQNGDGKHLPTESWYSDITMPETDVSQDEYDKIAVNTNNFDAKCSNGSSGCDDLWNRVSARDSSTRLTKDNIDQYLNSLPDRPGMLKYILYQLLKCGLIITGTAVPSNFGTWSWIVETWFANPMQGMIYVFGLILYLILLAMTFVGLFRESRGFAAAVLVLGLAILGCIIFLTSATQTTNIRTELISYPFIVIGIMIILMIIARLTDLSAMKNILIIYILAVIVGFNLYYTIFVPPLMVVLTFVQKLVLQTSIGFSSATAILNTIWKFGMMIAAIVYASVSTALSSQPQTAGTGNAITWVASAVIFLLIILNIVDSGSIRDLMKDRWTLVLIPFAALLAKIGGTGDIDLDSLSVGF